MTIMNLKEKLTNFQDKHLENENNREKLSRLYELGIIDSDGEYVPKINDDQINEDEKE